MKIYVVGFNDKESQAFVRWEDARQFVIDEYEEDLPDMIHECNGASAKEELDAWDGSHALNLSLDDGCTVEFVCSLEPIELNGATDVEDLS